MGYPEFNFGYQKEKNCIHFHFEKVERFLTSWPSPKNFSQLKRIFKQSLPRMLPKNVNLCSELFRVGFPSKTCYLCGKKGWYTKVIPQTLVNFVFTIQNLKPCLGCGTISSDNIESDHSLHSARHSSKLQDAIRRIGRKLNWQNNEQWSLTSLKTPHVLVNS